MARIKWNCQCNRDEVEKKVRGLAGEILNDWDAVVAFVFDPSLPPTNNDAERALRHAVIARRISFGTRTDEGSRFYAAALNVIDTCRKRGVETWGYACSLIAAARASLPPPQNPYESRRLSGGSPRRLRPPRTQKPEGRFDPRQKRNNALVTHVGRPNPHAARRTQTCAKTQTRAGGEARASHARPSWVSGRK